MAANQERREEYVRKWLKTPEGKEYMAKRNYDRRAVVKRTPAAELLTSVQWMELLREHDRSCYYCGARESDVIKLTRDHKIPVTTGGLHTKDNIVPACQPCNAKKGTKPWKKK